MGDPEGVATQLATLLRRPPVLTAIGAVRAPFLAGAQPANIDEGAVCNRFRSEGRKVGSGPAQPPPPPFYRRASDDRFAAASDCVP